MWGILLLASPFILSREGQVLRIKNELAAVSTAFGQEKADEISHSAGLAYKSLFIDTGYLSEKSKFYSRPMTPAESKLDGVMARPTTAFSNATNGYLTALSVNVYGLLLRWGIITHWMLFILPFVVAAFLDGFVTRKVKFAEFGFISPMAYSLSMHFIVFLLFFPLLYLVVPLPVTPYFMPGWAICLGFPLIFMISNTQRLFNG
ncbi:DUF4400 domain-containing protein [Undibacterium arcticum]